MLKSSNKSEKQFSRVAKNSSVSQHSDHQKVLSATSRRIFRPGDSFKPVEGLSEVVRRLHGQGRYRSALDEIFKVLDRDPDSEHALWLAMVVVGESRTQHLQAQEPLTPAYLNDRRLDPIFAACSHCDKIWVPTNCLLANMAKTMSMINPVGTQCSNCGYTLCRDCMETTWIHDVGFHSGQCPNCSEHKLGVPVFPTGRPPQQMARHQEQVMQAFVFREGPVPPDMEYMRRLLEIHSPDALEDQAELVGISMFPWPSDIEGRATAILIKMRVKKQLLGHLGEGEYAHVRDEDNNRVYIAKLMLPSPERVQEPLSYREPDTKALMNKESYNLIQRIVSSIKQMFRDRQVERSQENMSSVDKMVRDMIQRHLERVTHHFKSQPGFAVTESLSKNLLRPDVLTFTQKAVTEELRKSLLNGQHHWQSRSFGDLLLIISTVPALDIAEARTFFQGQYLTFVEDQVRLAGTEFGRVNVAHWVFCSDGDRMGVHLTLLPATSDSMMLLAQDMLTRAEKARLGM